MCFPGTGSVFGFEASSLFEGEGNAPNVGQTIIAIDPNISSGSAFAERMKVVVTAINDEQGVRQPGSRRFEYRRRSSDKGILIPRYLYEEIIKATG